MTISKILLPLIISLGLIGCGQKDTKNVEKGSSDPTLCSFLDNSCTKSTKGVNFTIKISPEEVPSEQDLHFRLTVDKTVINVKARLEGRDMFMGIIPVVLSQTESNTYDSQFMLGSCASGYMVWRLFISAEYQGQQINTHFDFLADNKQK
ncbi:hypothetical protein [Parashewanella curva]|nr:hypothetical protein [Parashewanella curva]